MRLVQPCRMIGCAHFKMVICDCSLALSLSLALSFSVSLSSLFLFLSLSLLLSLSLPSSSSPSSSSSSPSSSFSLYFFLLNESNEPHTCPYTMASGDFDHVLYTFRIRFYTFGDLAQILLAGRCVSVALLDASPRLVMRLLTFAHIPSQVWALSLYSCYVCLRSAIRFYRFHQTFTFWRDVNSRASIRLHDVWLYVSTGFNRLFKVSLLTSSYVSIRFCCVRYTFPQDFGFFIPIAYTFLYVCVAFVYVCPRNLFLHLQHAYVSIRLWHTLWHLRKTL